MCACFVELSCQKRDFFFWLPRSQFLTMGRVKVIKLRFEHSFIVRSDWMQVQTVNNKISALKKPLQTILFLGSLKGAEPLPAIAGS